MIPYTPLFILGNPRSGTSLFRLMLTSHQSIIIPPESHFFLWLEEKYGSWNKNQGLDDLLKDAFGARKFETWNLDYGSLKEFLIRKEVDSFATAIENIYLFYGERVGKSNLKVWGDKNKLWKEKLNSIPKYFPESKFIHVLRDGRDVACSYKDLASQNIQSKYAPKLPSDILLIGEKWRHNVDEISRFLERQKKDRYVTVKYEELILNTRVVLETVSEFLELDFDPGMMNYSLENQNGVYEPKEFMQWKKKLAEGPDRTNIGKYKIQLTPQEIDQFENVCKDALTKFGYL